MLMSFFGSETPAMPIDRCECRVAISHVGMVCPRLVEFLSAISLLPLCLSVDVSTSCGYVCTALMLAG